MDTLSRLSGTTFLVILAAAGTAFAWMCRSAARAGAPAPVRARWALATWLTVVAAVTLVPVTGGGSRVNLTPGADLSTSPAFLANATGNVALFVPLGALLAAAGPRLRLALVVVLAAGLSVAIEAVQYSAGLGRATDANDVVANSLGALLGGLIVASSRALRSRRAQTSGELAEHLAR